MSNTQKDNLSALGEKISYKRRAEHDRFDKADAAMDIHDKSLAENAQRVIRKSYALTKQDLDSISQIKDKCLDHKVVLNDSHIIRVAVHLASKLSTKEFISASYDVPRILVGRPRHKNK